MDKIPGFILIVWLLAIAFCLAVFGVAIWGGIELVQWITSGGLADAIHGT